MIEQAILYTDGGSRGNPGPSGIGFVILSGSGTEQTVLCDGAAYIGEATNNEAEYQALFWGLSNALALGVQHVDIRADSELLVKQVKGEYRVRSEGIKPLYNQVLKALLGFTSYEISHVYRKDNSRADALANEAMDKRESAGSFVVPCLVDPVQPVQSCRLSDTATLDSGEQDCAATPSMSNTTRPAALDSTANRRSTMNSGYYTLTVKDHFDAAHALVGYPGECRELHGHTWDIEVSVLGRELDTVGIVYDFKALKADLSGIINDYDHKYLNEVPPFDHINATAENLARIIYERLEKLLPSNIVLDEVSVWESPIAKLTYRRD